MTGSFEIRPCQVEECEEVLGLWINHHAPGVSDNLEDVKKLVTDFSDHLLVASSDNGIAGTVIAGWDGWRGHLHHLTVRPEFRRQGVARALVEEAEARLAAKGAKRVSVLAERDNQEANTFYESLHDLGYKLDTWMNRYTKKLTRS